MLRFVKLITIWVSDWRGRRRKKPQMSIEPISEIVHTNPLITFENEKYNSSNTSFINTSFPNHIVGIRRNNNILANISVVYFGQPSALLREVLFVTNCILLESINKYVVYGIMCTDQSVQVLDSINIARKKYPQVKFVTEKGFYKQLRILENESSQ